MLLLSVTKPRRVVCLRYAGIGVLLASLALPGLAFADSAPPKQTTNGVPAEPQGAPSPPPSSQAPDEGPSTVVPFELSLVHPVNLFHAKPKTIAGLSLNILHGYTSSVYGVEVGGLVNYADDNAGGIRVAGVLNYAGRSCYGVTAAGAVNYCGTGGGGLMVSLVNLAHSGESKRASAFHGIQWGGYNSVEAGGALFQLGLLSLAESGFGLQLASLYTEGDDFFGIQAAMLNTSMHRFGGLQFGFINWDNTNRDGLWSIVTPHEWSSPGSTFHYEIRHDRKGQFYGIQIGALFNSAMKAHGLQCAGLGNIAHRTLDGLQAAFLANGAGDVSGAQVSAINVAQDVVGLQVGVVNVARNLEGLQVGLVNVAYDNALPFMLGINAGFKSYHRDPEGADPPRDTDLTVHVVDARGGGATAWHFDR
jgi:hypothetical protein